MVGPVLVPLLLVGMVALWRSPHRWVSVAYGLVLVQTVATGGKPYYPAGLLPALLAAAAPPVVRWAGPDPVGRVRRRPALLAAALAVNLVGGSLAVLPWLPARAAQPLLATNYDLGEQVGWPELVQTVQDAATALPPDTVILTGNYGQAGALARARRAGVDLPPVFSGHNGFWHWGPPPESARTVVLVGVVAPPAILRGCRVVARLGNRAGLDNDEAGRPVSICRHDGTWAQDWAGLQRLG